MSLLWYLLSVDLENKSGLFLSPLNLLFKVSTLTSLKNVSKLSSKNFLYTFLSLIVFLISLAIFWFLNLPCRNFWICFGDLPNDINLVACTTRFSTLVLNFS